jgi:hypothetical protein
MEKVLCLLGSLGIYDGHAHVKREFRLPISYGNGGATDHVMGLTVIRSGRKGTRMIFKVLNFFGKLRLARSSSFPSFIPFLFALLKNFPHV